MEYPENLYYTKDHEWIRFKDSIAIIGITDFAQKELGDIVYVDIDSVGQNLTENEVFGTVEAVKTVSDLFLPIEGEVLSINQVIIDAPETVNTDPYGEGWMITIKPAIPSKRDGLLTSVEYRFMLGEQI